MVGSTTFWMSASLVKWAPKACRSSLPMLLWNSVPKIGGWTLLQFSSAAFSSRPISSGFSSTGSMVWKMPPLK